MRILLITVPEEGKAADYSSPNHFNDYFMSYPPLGLLCLIPHLTTEHTVSVLDCAAKKLTIAEAVTRIVAFRPDILGISLMTRMLYPFTQVAAAIRRLLPTTRIVAGGPHVTRFPVETAALDAAHFVLAGDAELTFARLVHTLARNADPNGIPGLYWRDRDGQVRGEPPIPAGRTLDEMPFPAREYLDPDDYRTAADRGRMTTVFSSRGCPFNCIFCDVPGKRFQFRSATRLVDEFEAIVRSGTREIHVFDDAFNIDRDRVITICREIVRRGLRFNWSARGRVAPFDREMAGWLQRAGCRRLHVGVETLDPLVLSNLGKGITREQIATFFALCREYRIDTMAYFIVGLPGETAAYRASLYEQIATLRPTYFIVSTLCPLPATAYYRSLLTQGTYPRDYWQEFITRPVPDFLLPYPRPVAEQRELEALAEDLPRRYYLRPSFILREAFRSIAAPAQLLHKIRLGLLLLCVAIERRLRPERFHAKYGSRWRGGR